MKTIVLIDNDALSRALISQCLFGEGWRVLEAENGETGFDLVMKHRPAAVLCDLRTPKGNGFRVCRMIRDEPQLKSTRLLLTSVSRFANDQVTALAAGADDYLVKPIVPTELLAALAKCGDSAVPAPTFPQVSDGPILLRFWGVRGSIPTPGRETAAIGGNTSCVEMRLGDQVVILDAGSGIRGLGKALTLESQGKAMNITMLVTHTHWDHIQGFPFFIPAYNPNVNVRILGYEGAVHGLRGALFEQMQSAFFPVGLNQMASHVTFEELEDMQFDLGPAKVRTIFSNHPGICLGYRIATGKGDVVYLPDHEAYERHERERQKVAAETSQPGIDYARSQDEKVIEFLRGADVLIADSQYDPSEYPSRLGWGHTCAEDTVDLAIRADVKQLFLFHHDPDHDDAKIEEMVAQGQAKAVERGSNLVVSAAREGAEFWLE